MDKRDHTATCHMDRDARASALAILQDYVPVLIHATGERARAMAASIEQCDCGRPDVDAHYHVRVHTQNMDVAQTFGPYTDAEMHHVFPHVTEQVEYVDQYLLAALLN